MMGPPGVGKGTQAKMLSDKFGIPKISTGDILRDAIHKGADLGLKAKAYMDNGQLVPDDVVIGIVEERLKEKDCTNGWILDGFPRTLPQAQALDDMLKRIGMSIDHVMNIEVGEEEVIRRLSGRRSCENCQAVYNIYFNKPQREGLCDICGGRLFQRSDDREEIVRERFRVYKEKTEPLISYYREQGILQKIYGDGDIEHVFETICSRLQ